MERQKAVGLISKTTMTSVELRGEEITDLPRRSQLNTQLKQRRKESLEKKKQACRDSNPDRSFPPAPPHLHSFLFRPWFSYRAAESRSFRTTHTKKYR